MLNWKIGRRIVCCVAVASTIGCLDLKVPNPNDPGWIDVLRTPEAIESLVSGAFQDWWLAENNRWPSNPFQVAADGTSSSWGDYGMRDVSSEPRKPYDNYPNYTYKEVNLYPWDFLYDGLSSVRIGLTAAGTDEMRPKMVEDLGSDGVARMEAFAVLVQALGLSSLATIFDRAYVVPADVDIDTIPVNDLEKMYPEIWAEALELYDEFIGMARGAEWTIEASWVGCKEDWSSERAIQVATAYRALYRAAIARNPEERAAVDWAAVRADATNGRTGYVGAYSPNVACSLSFSGAINPLLHFPDWSRADYRWIGPADASGGWEKWIASELTDRIEFAIDTDDRRITGGAPDIDGSYIRYHGNCPFPLDRGVYHCSWYRDYRWDYLLEDPITDWPVLDAKVFDFLVAEADYRRGDPAAAMRTVNEYREGGGLPAFTDPGGVAPGGNRCVPQNTDGSCGDLWAALKYEKQIELHGYGVSSGHFVDDRGWGDLVEGTFEQLPIPGDELDLLGLPIYTFPSESGDIAADTWRTVDRTSGLALLFADFSTEEDILELAAVMAARRKIAQEQYYGFVDGPK